MSVTTGVSLLHALALIAFAVAASAADGAARIAKPVATALECSAEQQASALAIDRIAQTPAACYAFQKWYFTGAALAFDEPDESDPASGDSFQSLKKRVYRDQSARLRTLRDVRDGLPGKPPAHGTIPLSLDIATRTPLGVFAEAQDYIGFADLVPMPARAPFAVRRPQRPMMRLDLFVLAGKSVLHLVLLAPLHGADTVVQGYRVGEDWARIIVGRERPASEP